MEYTYLGRTGVRVSRICMGCMSRGKPEWRPWVLAEEAPHRPHPVPGLGPPALLHSLRG